MAVLNSPNGIPMVNSKSPTNTQEIDGRSATVPIRSMVLIRFLNLLLLEFAYGAIDIQMYLPPFAGLFSTNRARANTSLLCQPFFAIFSPQPPYQSPIPFIASV